MDRRTLLAGIAGIALTGGIFRVTPVQAAGRTLLYISAGNCPSCRKWEAWEKDRAVTAAQAKGIGFREVKTTSFKDIREDSAWPSDLKWVLGKIKNKGGTPRFLMLQGQSVTANVFGTGGYAYQIKPMLGLA